MNPVIERRSGVIPAADGKVPEWTQEEAIAYECAREAISDLMGIKFSRLYEERRKENPDMALVTKLDDEITRLSDERDGLRLNDHASIARVRSEYGALVRAYYDGERVK